MAKGKGKPHKPNDRKEEKSSESSASSSNNGKKEDTSTSNEDAIKGESKQAERGERASQVLTVPNDIKVSEDIVEKVAPSDATISLGKIKRENSPPAVQNRIAQKVPFISLFLIFIFQVLKPQRQSLSRKRYPRRVKRVLRCTKKPEQRPQM